MSISFMSSWCASGTSLNVMMPQPRRKRSSAPKEMRAQNGSFKLQTSAGFETHVARRYFWGGGEATYDRDNLLLDQSGKRNQLQVKGEI